MCYECCSVWSCGVCVHDSYRHLLSLSRTADAIETAVHAALAHPAVKAPEKGLLDKLFAKGTKHIDVDRGVLGSCACLRLRVFCGAVSKSVSVGLCCVR